MATHNTQHDTNNRRWGRILMRSGVFVMMATCIAGVIVYLPLLREEVRYYTRDALPAQVRVMDVEGVADASEDMLVAADAAYSIIVPKIGANAPVVEDVDPYDESSYRAALTQGVAHAAGSVAPGARGNAFFFAHSSDSAYAQNRYNTEFLLLSKLEPGDHFYIVRDGVIYDYRMYEQKVVAADAVEYLMATSEYSVATLMTCWPPGTDSKRSLVFGVLEGVYEDGVADIVAAEG